MVRRLRRRAAEAAGYTLVALVVLITVIQVVGATALPSVTQAIQREKEAEAIFRGLQYAEAIRVFQVRFGRYPVKLEELIKVNPRSIRQLWDDPLSDDGEWGVILAQAAGRQVGGGEGEDDEVGRNLNDRRNSRNRGRAGARNRGRDPVVSGPIIGVHSKAKGKAIRSFMDAENYSEWRFTPDLLPTTDAALMAENVPRLHTRWLGRALPEGLEAMGGGMPESVEPDAGEDNQPASRPSRRNRRGRGRGG